MILVGKVNLKKVFLISAFTFGAVLADMNINQSSSNQNNELRFLGWGKRVTYSECYDNGSGEMVKTRQTVFTAFWLKVGEPEEVQVAC